MKARQPVELDVPSRLAPNRLLVPTNLSNESRRALAYAGAFARQFGSRLYVLFVVETAPFAAGLEALPIAMDHAQTLSSAQRELEQWLRNICPEDLAPVPLVREGKPVPEVIAAAKEEEIDLVIISTHGRAGVKRLVLGSTAEEIIRQAPCPVLVVREKGHECLQPPTSCALSGSA